MRALWACAVFILALSASMSLAAGSAMAQSDETAIAVHLFWAEGCPHCSKAQRFLAELARQQPSVRLHQHEVSGNEGDRELFRRVSAAFAIETPAVPLVVVGDRHFLGYLDDRSTGGAIRDAIRSCAASDCPDIVAFFLRQMMPSGQRGPGRGPPVTETVRLPWFGDVSTATISLPALTVLLALVDGFNPCAMWVLLFLIGLLLGMTDHVRMWALGVAFLVASAGVYYVFMAAWLNLLLSLSELVWIRLAVGTIAVAGGGYYLVGFARNRAAVCHVTNPVQRQRLLDRMRQAVREKSFLLALGGVMAVAVAVNLIDLVCSAGLPAVYTQVLALSALPAWQFHLYLLLYVIVFMLDDLAVFALAIWSLQAAGLTGRYARFSHLIGGAVLTGLGALLLFRPEWLKFQQ